MRRATVFLGLALLAAWGAWACSSDTGNGTPGPKPDSGTPPPPPPLDSGAGDDASSADAGGDAACAASWLVAPEVDPSIAVPDGGGGTLLHATATGTQNYACSLNTDAGTYAWTFTGPEATLSDCNAVAIGEHFASDGGATAPEWRTTDGSYVVGKKVAAFTPDGGAGAVPWLLLKATSQGGSGALGRAAYVQRLSTTGGVAPAAACAAGNTGETQKVAYTAHYFFFGP